MTLRSDSWGAKVQKQLPGFEPLKINKGRHPWLIVRSLFLYLGA
jgi:hypothetical protein